METAYDSKADTLLHIKRVAQLLTEAASELIKRANVHDDSKLESPEKELFDEFTPLLINSSYMDPLYNSFRESLKVALDHHYANNTHHPEHYDSWHCAICGQDRKESETWLSTVTEPPVRFCLPCSGGHAIYETGFMPEDFRPGINGMDLFDVLEMFFDWKAAGERHNGNIYDSIEKNKDRFQMSDQLVSIFQNTAKKLNY